MKHSPFAGSFTHLLGLRPRSKKAKNEDSKPEDKKGKKAEEDEEEEGSEDDSDEKKAEGEDTEAEDSDEEKKAEDDSDDEKTKGNAPAQKTYAAGRADERARCAAIFASPVAAGQPHIAAKLAFTTNLTVKQVTGILAETVSSAPTGLSDRMARTGNPNPGSDSGAAHTPDSPEGIAARMRTVYDRVNGKK